MTIWLLLGLIFISAVPAIAVYIWFRLAKYPVSSIKYLITLLIGATSIFPALILQNLLIPFRPAAGRAALFYEFFFRIAFTEELSRLLFLFVFFSITARLLRRNQNASTPALSWNTVKMGAALGLVAGLGFAILENAIYTAGNMNLGFLLLRAFTAAPIHAACSSRVGAAAVMLRTNPVQSIFRFLTAIAIHGIYNILLELSIASSTSSILILIMAILIAYSALITAIMSIKGSWTEVEQ